MATLYSLRKNVLDRYGGPDRVPGWVTPEWLRTTMNDGQRFICEQTECLLGSAGVSGTSGARTYALPASFVRVTAAEWGTAGELLMKSRDDIRAKADTWRTATGHPEYYYPDDGQRFGVYPKIAPGSAGTIYLYGPRYATELTNPTSVCELPTSLHRALEEYVANELEENAGPPEGKQAGIHAQRTAAEIAKYKHVRPAILTIAGPSRR